MILTRFGRVPSNAATVRGRVEGGGPTTSIVQARGNAVNGMDHRLRAARHPHGECPKPTMVWQPSDTYSRTK